MTHSRHWLLLAAGLLATIPGFAREMSNRPIAAEQLAHLEKFRSDAIQGILSGKPETILSYYAESIRLMPEYQKTILGKTNASSYYQAVLRRFDVREFNREKIEIADLGSRVIEVGLFTLKLGLKRTGREDTLAGKYLDIWEKSENGRLALVTEAWNYNHPVAFADDLKFTEVPSVHMALQDHLPVRGNIRFELAALNKLLEAAVTQHDAKVWSQFYADDGICLPGHSPLCQGRKALDEFLEHHCRELPVFEHLDIRNDRVEDLGDYVIEYATHVANWRNGESSGVTTGKDIRIWRREADCFLKLFRSIGMYD